MSLCKLSRYIFFYYSFQKSHNKEKAIQVHAKFCNKCWTDQKKITMVTFSMIAWSTILTILNSYSSCSDVIIHHHQRAQACLSEMIAINEEHEGRYHEVPRQIHCSLHIWPYIASHRQSQLRRQFAHSQFSAMATIVFSKRVGNVGSGVVVWPKQLSRKFSVRHNQRHANTHI